MPEQNNPSSGMREPLSPIVKIIIALSVALAVAALAALLWMFAFTARTRTVDGLKTVRNPDGSENGAYSEEGIFISAGISENTGFLFIDTEKAEAKLTQALPYIESAKIVKKYPSKVVISPVYTRAAFAADVSGTGVWALLSPTFKVLDTGAVTLPDNVTILKGIDFGELTAGRQVAVNGKEDKSDIVTELYAKLTATYAPDRIKLIDVTSTMSIGFVFSAEYTITVNLGSRTDLDKKLKLAGDSIEYTLTHGFNRNATLDISNVDGAIYHPEPVSEEETGNAGFESEDDHDDYDDEGDYDDDDY